MNWGKEVATPSFQQNTLPYVPFTIKSESKENKMNKIWKVRPVRNSSDTDNTFISIWANFQLKQEGKTTLSSSMVKG